MGQILAYGPCYALGRGTVDIARSVPFVPKLLAVLHNRVRAVVLAGELDGDCDEPTQEDA
jgi:hypothetical protein